MKIKIVVETRELAVKKVKTMMKITIVVEARAWVMKNMKTMGKREWKKRQVSWPGHGTHTMWCIRSGACVAHLPANLPEIKYYVTRKQCGAFLIRFPWTIWTPGVDNFAIARLWCFFYPACTSDVTDEAPLLSDFFHDINIRYFSWVIWLPRTTNSDCRGGANPTRYLH